MSLNASGKILWNILCVAYLIGLTFLLLSERPEQLLGMQAGLPKWLRALLPIAHLLSFLVLSLLALTARWPLPRWGTALLLLAYGGATELLQGFIPGRAPEWLDWLQDLAGVAVGAVICWAVARVSVTLARAWGVAGNGKPVGRV